MAAKGMKICPACKGECHVDLVNCPWCPYTFQQYEGEHKKPRKFGPAAWGPAVWALIVALLMLGAWRLVEFVISNADPEAKNTAIEKFVAQQRIVVQDKNGVKTVISPGDGTTYSSERAKQVGGVTNAAWAAGARNAPTDVKAAVDALPDEDQEVVIGQGGPAPAEVKEWKLRGVVYDLVTLEPIPHCTVYFTDPKTHARYETSTDDTGSYKTIVPPLAEDGYQVTFQKDGYAKSYLNPGTENVSEMAAADRRTTASELAKTFDPPYEVQAAGAAPMKTDFYLAPAQ